MVPTRSTRSRCAAPHRTLRLESLEQRQLLAVDGFAPIDGVGNNEAEPALGVAGEQFLRIAPSAYED